MINRPSQIISDRAYAQSKVPVKNNHPTPPVKRCCVEDYRIAFRILIPLPNPSRILTKRSVIVSLTFEADLEMTLT